MDVFAHRDWLHEQYKDAETNKDALTMFCISKQIAEADAVINERQRARIKALIDSETEQDGQS